jgi:Cupin-like domain
VLYLPALWYHKVSQTSDPVERFCLAVNYWSVFCNIMAFY